MKANNFPTQCDALLTARFYIRQLGPEAVFGLTVTEEDGEDCSVLNIYVLNRLARQALENKLFPDRLRTDMGNHFSSYRVNSLLISIIAPERTQDD